MFFEMIPSAAAVLGFGFVLGLKHAVEADHVAAVSTLAVAQKSVRTASLLGAFWGAGHTTTLLLVGALVLALKISIPPSFTLVLELVIGIMLVFLGFFSFRSFLRANRHMHSHSHGTLHHSHSHHVLHHAKAPFLVGMIHGLAGSAALMLLVLASIDTVSVGILYLLIFGLGSVAGMMLVSALLGLSLQLFRRSDAAIRMAAGLFSAMLGISLIITAGRGLIS